eukprot:ANDGO_04761.mRNA.1 hypothetical protein
MDSVSNVFRSFWRAQSSHTLNQDRRISDTKFEIEGDVVQCPSACSAASIELVFQLAEPNTQHGIALLLRNVTPAEIIAAVVTASLMQMTPSLQYLTKRFEYDLIYDFTNAADLALVPNDCVVSIASLIDWLALCKLEHIMPQWKPRTAGLWSKYAMTLQEPLRWSRNHPCFDQIHYSFQYRQNTADLPPASNGIGSGTGTGTAGAAAAPTSSRSSSLPASSVPPSMHSNAATVGSSQLNQLSSQNVSGGHNSLHLHMRHSSGNIINNSNVSSSGGGGGSNTGNNGNNGNRLRASDDSSTSSFPASVSYRIAPAVAAEFSAENPSNASGHPFRDTLSTSMDSASSTPSTRKGRRGAQQQLFQDLPGGNPVAQIEAWLKGTESLHLSTPRKTDSDPLASISVPATRTNLNSVLGSPPRNVAAAASATPSRAPQTLDHPVALDLRYTHRLSSASLHSEKDVFITNQASRVLDLLIAAENKQQLSIAMRDLDLLDRACAHSSIRAVRLDVSDAPRSFEKIFRLNHFSASSTVASAKFPSMNSFNTILGNADLPLVPSFLLALDHVHTLDIRFPKFKRSPFQNPRSASFISSLLTGSSRSSLRWLHIQGHEIMLSASQMIVQAIADLQSLDHLSIDGSLQDPRPRTLVVHGVAASTSSSAVKPTVFMAPPPNQGFTGPSPLIPREGAYSKDSIHATCDILSTSDAPLEHVSICNADLRDAGCIEICAALCKRATHRNTRRLLQSLTLRNGNIGYQGGAAIAELMSTFYSSLQHLDLGGNFLSRANTLICLGIRATLVHLDLSWNALDDGCIANLCDALRTSSYRVRRLSVANSAVSERNLTLLFQAVGRNRTLQEIDISKNFIGVLGLTAMIHALDRNQTLQKIVCRQMIVFERDHVHPSRERRSHRD